MLAKRLSMRWREPIQAALIHKRRTDEEAATLALLDGHPVEAWPPVRQRRRLGTHWGSDRADGSVSWPATSGDAAPPPPNPWPARWPGGPGPAGRARPGEAARFGNEHGIPRRPRSE